MPAGPPPPEARAVSSDDEIELPAGPAPRPNIPAPPPAIMAKRVGVALSSDAITYDREEQELLHAKNEAEEEVRAMEKIIASEERAAAGAERNTTISAAPQLRDVQKEVTAFIPPSVRRRTHVRGTTR